MKAINYGFKAIVTKYHGPSNTKGSRISASDGDGNRITIGYHDADNTDLNHARAALALCEKMGWDKPERKQHIVGGWIKGGEYAWVFAIGRG
jgi:hypothetical protein